MFVGETYCIAASFTKSSNKQFDNDFRMSFPFSTSSSSWCWEEISILVQIQMTAVIVRRREGSVKPVFSPAP